MGVTTGDTENQIDHIAIARRWRLSLQDVRTKRGADVSSDHHLLVAKIKLKLLGKKRTKAKRWKFNIGRLKDPKIVTEYQLSLRNRFSALQHLNEYEEDINSTWELTRDAIIKTCEETLGFIQQNRKRWISEKTWETICERRQDKERILNAKTRQQKRQTTEKYVKRDKEVKKRCKQDKRDYVEQLAQQAESACGKGDIMSLYNTIRQLGSKPLNNNTPVKDKSGVTLSKLEDQLGRWKEHFQEVLNRPPPTDPPNLEAGPTLNIEVGDIMEAEVITAIRHLKNGKAGGIDNTHPEPLKLMDNVSLSHLHHLLNRIWNEEYISEDWHKGLLVKLPKKGNTSLCNKIGKELRCYRSPAKY